MVENRAEWASGHGQLTKIGLSDGCGGKTYYNAVQFGYDAMYLKVIWEMSANSILARTQFRRSGTQSSGLHL